MSPGNAILVQNIPKFFYFSNLVDTLNSISNNQINA